MSVAAMVVIFMCLFDGINSSQQQMPKFQPAQEISRRQVFTSNLSAANKRLKNSDRKKNVIFPCLL
jgi:hypothetical protein